jgi:hypothetical protein
MLLVLTRHYWVQIYTSIHSFSSVKLQTVEVARTEFVDQKKWVHKMKYDELKIVSGNLVGGIYKC